MKFDDRDFGLLSDGQTSGQGQQGRAGAAGGPTTTWQQTAPELPAGATFERDLGHAKKSAKNEREKQNILSVRYERVRFRIELCAVSNSCWI